MAVVTNQADSKLKVVLNAGLNDEGKNIIKNKTYGNIKSTVTNEDLYNVGIAITEIQSHTLMNLVRYEEYELVNEII